jgi:hypothetical protein
VGVALDDVENEVPVDELELSAGGEAESVGGEAVEVAQAAEGRLVEHREGVRRDDGAGGPGGLKPVFDVLYGILGLGFAEAESAVDARPQRAVLAQGQALPELGESDEDQRQQRLRIPLVVREHMQVLEDVGSRVVS